MPDESAAPSRKDRKRAEIVAIAQELFFREGYTATSMSQIAAAVGGSKQTLYNHFRSKDELLLAVVQDVLEPKTEDYDSAGLEPSEFRAWLAWFGHVTAKKMTSHDYVSLQRLAASEALRCPDVGRIFHDAHMMPSLMKFGQSFSMAMDKGILRRADPQVAVRQFIEMCLGWMLRRVLWNIQAAPSEAEIEKDVGEAVSAFMDGYEQRHGRPSRKKESRRRAA